MDESDKYTGNSKIFTNENKQHQTIVWRNVILFAYLHLAALYGVLLIFTSAKMFTIIFGMLPTYKLLLIFIFLFENVFFFCLAILMYQVASIGITGGAHRLWSHRSYKAKWPLRLILIIFNTIAFQVLLFNVFFLLLPNCHT